jgi:hypothetical protein
MSTVLIANSQGTIVRLTAGSDVQLPAELHAVDGELLIKRRSVCETDCDSVLARRIAVVRRFVAKDSRFDRRESSPTVRCERAHDCSSARID